MNANINVGTIYVNLPVKNIEKTREFWSKLGFAFNEQFSDDKALCLILNEGNIYAMLMSHEFYKTFTNRPIADGSTTQVLLAIDVGSRDKVDEIIKIALENGATKYLEPSDFGWMYYDRFIDPDGHQWEVMFSDESLIPLENEENEKQDKRITIETIVSKPVDQVWEMWTLPIHIMQWNNASDDWFTPSAENNLIEGGRFNYKMAARDGSYSFDFSGTYNEVIIGKKIAYTLDDDRKTIIEFIEEDGKVKIVETFEAEEHYSLEKQRAGWQAILDNFNRYVSAASHQPLVKTQMLIRKPIQEVFEAFVNPEITTRFWFTKSSGRLNKGQHVRWEWEMYGVWDDVFVKNIEQNKRIDIEFSDKTITEWVFTSYTETETFVTITNTGFMGSEDEVIRNAIDSMGGYTMVLCGLKALLEHNIELNLVADKAPDAQATRS